MTNASWHCLRLTCARDDAELIAYLLSECGALGTETDDTQVVFDQSEDATLAPKKYAVIRAYFADESSGESEKLVRATLRENNVRAEIAPEAIAETDWATAWRENFPPLSIPPFLIAPSWEKVDATSAILIRLDPGLAFGTGQHPTTYLCLELLAQELQKLRIPKAAATLLDVGCGSGILSIAAKKFAQAVDLNLAVTGSDLDAFCIAATRENAALNDVDISVVQTGDADWTSEKFDLVIANLMSDLLIRLAPELRARVASGGTLIVSGISSPRADEVEAALQNAGVTTREKREREGEARGDFIERWAAFVFSGQGSGSGSQRSEIRGQKIKADLT